jgi:hypothetical protein
MAEGRDDPRQRLVSQTCIYDVGPYDRSASEWFTTAYIGDLPLAVELAAAALLQW